MGSYCSRILNKKKGNLTFPVILMLLIIGITVALLEFVVSLKTMEIRENNKMNERYKSSSVTEIAASQLIADLNDTFVDEISIAYLRGRIYDTLDAYITDYDRNTISIDYSSVISYIDDIEHATERPYIEVWYGDSIIKISHIKIDEITAVDPDNPEIEIPGAGSRPNLIIKYKFNMNDTELERLIKTDP